MQPAQIADIVPVTGIRDAIRWRDALAEAIANLIRDYEKRVPHSKIEAIAISRVEAANRIGVKRSQITVLPKVVLTS